MLLNAKYPVQLKNVHINELVELLRLVNTHLHQVDKSYKVIKDKELDQAYRQVRKVCKRWSRKVEEMSQAGRSSCTTRLQLQQFIPLYHLFRLLTVGQPVSNFAQQMLFRMDQHYHSLPIREAGTPKLNYQKNYANPQLLDKD